MEYAIGPQLLPALGRNSAENLRRGNLRCRQLVASIRELLKNTAACHLTEIRLGNELLHLSRTGLAIEYYLRCRPHALSHFSARMPRTELPT